MVTVERGSIGTEHRHRPVSGVSLVSDSIRPIHIDTDYGRATPAGRGW